MSSIFSTAFITNAINQAKNVKPPEESSNEGVKKGDLSKKNESSQETNTTKNENKKDDKGKGGNNEKPKDETKVIPIAVKVKDFITMKERFNDLQCKMKQNNEEMNKKIEEIEKNNKKQEAATRKAMSMLQKCIQSFSDLQNSIESGSKENASRATNNVLQAYRMLLSTRNNSESEK